MSIINIENINESHVRLNCELGILREIANRFTFRADNFMFHPRYKAGVWDGFIRPINQKNGFCPKGLVPKVINYIKDNGYSYTLDESFERFKENIEINLNELNLPFEPHKHQMEAVELFAKKKRQVILSATGSGKSLIVFMIIRILLKQVYENQKILIIVPSISLVTQMFNDFIDYSAVSKWDTNANVHSIMAGVKKDSDKKIYLSTWQSLQNIKDNTYFEKFGAVIVDECHGASASVLSSLMEKCTNAFYRIGVSGTLSGSKIDETALIGHFGPITRVSSTSDLINKNILSQLKIAIIRLKYPEAICDSLKHTDYTGEMDWLVKCQQRNEFICNIANTLNGNTLILVQFVEKHGKQLEVMLNKICSNKKVFFVYGNTEADDRENVRKIAEKHSDVIILASYQVFSTGVNIKNLPNIILASSTKSVIRLLQSIGRGLRKHDDKEVCTIIDITDDLRGKRKKANYTLSHCMERIEIYQKENFKIVEKVIDLSNKF